MKCRCSADRVRNVLVSFPRDEIVAMKVGDYVVVTCEFCNVGYRFDVDQIDTIFKESASG